MWLTVPTTHHQKEDAMWTRTILAHAAISATCTILHKTTPHLDSDKPYIAATNGVLAVIAPLSIAYHWKIPAWALLTGFTVAALTVAANHLMHGMTKTSPISAEKCMSAPLPSKSLSSTA